MGSGRLIKIAFYGPAGSGKTWCANYVHDHYHFRKIAFAGKLKEIAKDLFNVRGKNGSDRKTLQDIGQKMREIRSSVWIDYLLDTAKTYEGEHYSDHPGFVLDDLRYVNEGIALRDAGFTLIRCHVPQDTLEQRRRALYPDTPALSYYHASESEWEQIVPDYEVESTDNSAKDVIQKIVREINGSF